MAPLISPRSLARDLLLDLATHSPFHSATRQSTPTRPPTTLTLRSVASRLIIPRLATDVTTVPEGYGRTRNGPDAGTVVGIVLGSVAGFLLVLWLIYTLVNLGNPKVTVETASVGTASVVTRKSRHKKRKSHHSHSHSHGSPVRRETVEVRRERIVVDPPPPPRPDRIVVEETTRSRSRAPPPPPTPPPPMSESDDEVVVIEENSPPRRRESRHKRRSAERRSGGAYRDVDPYLYAGGDAPMRDVSRRRSESRRR
ncbi:uncharacterized protein BCR38DRAFT_485945 [Pseudomassariella vexata]|uniref:Uncharacterized protein n=1 Tax=Pseudomassariella vexata TaxID=1141098 RepID=A0A1Y2DVG4_9PEZI|nr:uncharacterized protein BCR38DRAFT_485945 [Pseudomassariella vexata]ORY63179.1 hypothetical protein BCR38DRAFT_485945 [Pseudomassariella vexata]